MIKYQFICDDFVHVNTDRKMWDTLDECLLFYMNSGSKVIRKYKTIVQFEISECQTADGESLKSIIILGTYDIKKCIRIKSL